MGKILIAGYGSAGQYVLDFIARMDELRDSEIVVMSRTPGEDIIGRINITAVSAGIMGYYPKIRYICNDLNDVARTAEILKEENPDIIAYTGRFIKGIKYGAYSYPNEIGYGAWIPLAIPLIYKLMLAVKSSGINTKVINSSFPDGVNPALESIGLAPFTGAGNLNHLIPRLTLAIANKYGLSPYDVNVDLVGSHYLNTYVSKEGSSKGSPYVLKFSTTGRSELIQYHEITGADAEELFSHCSDKTASGPTRNLMIASDIAQIIKSLSGHNVTKIHLPGPQGLPGGYPVFLSRNMLINDAGINPSEAILTNLNSLRYDGIDDISEGVITFTEELISKMKNVFNIEYPKSLKVEDCEDFAYVIKAKLLEYERRLK